jgi:RNA polymerase sigma factor (sigma-70 family)
VRANSEQAAEAGDDVVILQTDAHVIAASIDAPDEFAHLFDRHARAVQGYLLRRVPSSAADDLLASTFLTAFEKRHRFDASYDDARPWLLGIATNHIRAHQRSETRGWGIVKRVTAQLGGSSHEDQVESLVERVDAQREASALSSVLSTLSEGDRDALLLFAWEDLSYSEISVALGIPIGTVRSRLNRARRLLRFALRNSTQEEAG